MRSEGPGTRSGRLVRCAVLAGLAAVLAFPAAGAGSVGPATAAGAVRIWSPQFMDTASSVTLAEAVAAAKSYDVVAAHTGVFTPYVRQMRAANPRLQLFVYMKGTFTRDTTLPEAAYAHDANGQRIYGLHYAGTWLLDPSSQAATDYELSLASRLLDSSGYDGIYLDTIGTAPLHKSYVSGLPIDQATEQPWTARDWLAATGSLATKIAASTGRPLIGNGLRDGSAFYDSTEGPTSALAQAGISGAVAESWLRPATDPIGSYPDLTTWKQDVDMIAAAGAHHTSVFAITKLWTNGTAAQKKDWYTFAVASFLLGNNGQSYLSVSYEQGDLTVPRPLNHVDLGSPTGRYAQSGGLYLRGFAHGLVIVNPTASAHTLLLRRTDFKTLAAKPIRRVVLTPHTAIILKLPASAAKKS